MKLDMHFHSVASDGRSTKQELIAVAKEKNVQFLALTDHDVVSYGFREEAENAGIMSCQSVEISVNNKQHNKSLHLTFYAESISERVSQVLSNIVRTKVGLIEQQIRFFNQHGFDIKLDEFYKIIIQWGRTIESINKFDIVGFIYFTPYNRANAIKLNDGIEIDSEWFYQKFLKKWWEKFSEYWVKIKDYEPTLEICKSFKEECNGILSIAHPNVTFRKWIQEFEEVLPHYIEFGWVNAIEINAKASKEWIASILQAKSKYNLYLTFWSDSHKIWHSDSKHWDFWELNTLLSPDLIQASFNEYRNILRV